MEQGRCPEGAIVGLAPGEIEGLERVEEGVPFGMMARILTDAIEAEEEIEEIVVHARGARRRATRVASPRGAVTPTARGRAMTSTPLDEVDRS